MPTIGWIDALRTYNAGMPSWCVPRKGTPGYERVMRIRQGEQTKGFKEVLEDLERKTSGKPKKEKKTMAIDLSASKEEVKVPTLAGGGSVKTDHSTKKMSGSNNKKAMAVVPVNYVAEEKPKEESKPEVKKVAKGGSKKASGTAPPGATMNDLYYTIGRAKETTSLWREDADRYVRVGEWKDGKFIAGPAIVREKLEGRRRGFKVGKTTTDLSSFRTLPNATKTAAYETLGDLGYLTSTATPGPVAKDLRGKTIAELRTEADVIYDRIKDEVAQKYSNLRETSEAEMAVLVRTTRDSPEIEKLRKQLRAMSEAETEEFKVRLAKSRYSDLQSASDALVLAKLNA